MGMTDEEVAIHDQLNALRVQVKSIEHSKVVLIGDIMLDRYIHGYANNLNSNAPVPVLKETSREEDVGGAAHVARGLISMGVETHLFGVVGNDRAGLNILESLEEEGVHSTGIAIVEGITTTVKNRLLATRESLVSEEQLLLRWDIEGDEEVPVEAIEALFGEVIFQMDDATAVIISDYGQGVIVEEGVKMIIDAASEKNIPIIADPKLTGLHHTHGVDWVIFQANGLELMRRRLGADNGDAAAHLLIKNHSWKNLVVVCGAGGVTIYSDDGSSVHAECTLADLRQMIGLVDAAVVAIAVAISEKLGVSHTAQLVNAACECILAASSSDSFVLSRDELVDRIGEMAWNLQVSKR
ncbi:MAG: PfkB family carbohydrate kinase [Candidatus Poseidoniaceae archaeon]|nr:PfkB family carbohydrate kinase [Candidatus Poseidoniaceae archaeon]